MYNPGVQDQSGQILAQGIGQLGNSIQQGMQSYAQNKQMAALALGKFEGALQANPDLLKFLNPDQPSPNAPSDAVKAFMKLQKDGTLGVRDAAMLSTFADTYTKAKEDKQQAEMRAMQMQHMQQQMAEAQSQNADSDAMNAKFAQMAALGQRLNQGTPVQGPVQNGPMAALAGTPDGPMALGASSLLNAVPGNLNGGGVVRPEISQQAQDFLNTKAGYLASQGVKLNPAQMVDLTKTDQNAASREAIARMKMQGAPIKLDKYRVDSNGKTYEVAIDANTGREVARGIIKEPPRAYPTPEEAGATELAKTSGSESAKQAAAHLQSVTDNAEGAQEALARIGQVKKLYQDGETTGSGQEALNILTGAAVRLGIYPRDKQGNKEELQAALATDALMKAKDLMKGQGSISDKERARIDTISANVGKTPEANLAALSISEALAKRAMDQERIRRELYDNGESPVKISEQIKRWRLDNPLPAFDYTAPAKGGTAAPAPIKILSIKKVGN